MLALPESVWRVGPEASGRTVAADPSHTVRQDLHLDEPGPLDPLEDQLGDPVAAAQLDRLGEVVVDQQHLHLAAVAGVDGAGGVHDRQPVPGGQPRARVHQRDVPLGHRDRDPGRHQRPLPRRQGHVDGGHQVGAGVAGMGVRRERELGVEADDGHRELHPPDPTSAMRRSGRIRSVDAGGLRRAAGRPAALVGAGHDAGRQPLAGPRRRAPRPGRLGVHRGRAGPARRAAVSYGGARVERRRRLAPRRPGPDRGGARRRGRRRWTPRRPAGSPAPRPTPAPTCCCGPT